ncbi:metallophosphoesterase [Clostridium tyrobutyricum]|uniref:metallophosphoesterase n=1 Tax=Clostridium tyrobutyricum TaxID=1519 RepID=UPI00057E26AA|nr:metallophosphoesterase [Clostridium tyrobutyricum]MBV4446042.1 metallophosphoesterase [Clostridium tyrobutyricum]
MKIGVISDTHGYNPSIKKIVKIFDNPDLIIHLGDNVGDVDYIRKVYSGKIINVRGNCDFSTDAPSERLEVIGGKRFFITHGHNYNVKYDLLRLKYRAMELKADAALFGHTHISEITCEDGIWLINPGSPHLSRDGRNSVAIIDIENGSINASIEEV